MSSIRNCTAILAAAALVLPGAVVQARSAGSLSDLVGARAGQAEGSLRDRGFTHIETHQSHGAVDAYWWSQAADDCVRVTTSDGRYTSITDAADSDCHKHQGNGAAAAIGVGVGAAILGALIAGGGNDEHRSHHHDGGQHNQDLGYEAQYERGFRDGLYNESYHNYDRAQGYTEGYETGVREREGRTGHRNGHSGRGGYAPSVYVGDLQGQQRQWAADQLRNRGFTRVDQTDTGNTRYDIWWSGNTRQCLQATLADGRVYDIRDIGQHPNCR